MIEVTFPRSPPLEELFSSKASFFSMVICFVLASLYEVFFCEILPHLAKVIHETILYMSRGSPSFHIPYLPIGGSKFLVSARQTHYDEVCNLYLLYSIRWIVSFYVSWISLM